jgi:hypothetical protein
MDQMMMMVPGSSTGMMESQHPTERLQNYEGDKLRVMKETLPQTRVQDQMIRWQKQLGHRV